MNCETFTRIDTSSLYKNNRLIAQASSLFLIRNCQDLKMTITKCVYCFCNKRYVRIYFDVPNINGSNSTLLDVCVVDNCCNMFNKKFIICNCKNNYYIDLPFPCYKHYFIKARIVQNDILIQEECMRI